MRVIRGVPDKPHSRRTAWSKELVGKRTIGKSRIEGSQQPIATARNLTLASLNLQGIREMPGGPGVNQGDGSSAIGVSIHLHKELALRRKCMSGENQTST